MKITAKIMAILVFVFIFGGISISAAMGQWQTETSKIPVTFTEGEAAGQYNPADIRGSYSFEDISTLFEIPIEDLGTAFRLDSNIAETKLKDLETIYESLDVEVGTASVRLFTALYKGLPFDLSAEDTYLFKEAVELLKEKATLSSDQLAYLEAHKVPELAVSPEQTMPALTSEPITIQTPTPAPAGTEEHTPTPGTITGKTTFQDLLDWRVAQADIETVIGKPLPAPKTLIKDWATAEGIAFSELKTKLQALVDAVK